MLPHTVIDVQLLCRVTQIEGRSASIWFIDGGSSSKALGYGNDIGLVAALS